MVCFCRKGKSHLASAIPKSSREKYPIRLYVRFVCWSCRDCDLTDLAIDCSSIGGILYRGEADCEIYISQSRFTKRIKRRRFLCGSFFYGCIQSKKDYRNGSIDYQKGGFMKKLVVTSSVVIMLSGLGGTYASPKHPWAKDLALI